MTVGELVKLLMKQDPELEVRTEGCDCWGDVGGVEVVETQHRAFMVPADKEVLIMRPK